MSFSTSARWKPKYVKPRTKTHGQLFPASRSYRHSQETARGASSTLMQDIAQGYVPDIQPTSLKMTNLVSSGHLVCVCCFSLPANPGSSTTSQHFNEIMPCIYARFMEKEARQWRQIYKVIQDSSMSGFLLTQTRQALQLLEYLIKHGSERVVDDARSHVSMIKMLRNFHYIDDKGKDEGINGM